MSKLIRRREMMRSKASDQAPTYWLCGADAPVNGVWVDRGNGATWTLGSTTQHIGNYYFLSGIVSSCLTLPDAQKNLYDLGHHWRAEFDFDIQTISASENGLGPILDFGALGNVSKALGFGFDAKVGSANIRINWKMQGNSSNPFTTANTFTVDTPDVYQSYVAIYEIYDNGEYDKFATMVNGERMVNPADVPKVAYSGWLSSFPFCIGRGGYMHGSTYGKYRIRNIKIFVID